MLLKRYICFSLFLISFYRLTRYRFICKRCYMPRVYYMEIRAKNIRVRFKSVISISDAIISFLIDACFLQEYLMGWVETLTIHEKTKNVIRFVFNRQNQNSYRAYTKSIIQLAHIELHGEARKRNNTAIKMLNTFLRFYLWVMPLQFVGCQTVFKPVLSLRTNNCLVHTF